MKTVPTPLETIEQQNFVKYARFWLRLKGLDQLLFAIPNEGFRDIKNRSRMIAEGLVSGVPESVFSDTGWKISRSLYRNEAPETKQSYR
jgi:hypothetical protein